MNQTKQQTTHRPWTSNDEKRFKRLVKKGRTMLDVSRITRRSFDELQQRAVLMDIAFVTPPKFKPGAPHRPLQKLPLTPSLYHD